MSQNVEELQWRIKNNLELPVNQRPIFAVSSENPNNTSSNQNKVDSWDDNRGDGGLSPSSSVMIELLIEEGIGNEEYLYSDNADGDSLDEGLGDISSDETGESPVPNIEKEESQDSYENEKCGQEQSHVLEMEKERRPSRISLETPL